MRRENIIAGPASGQWRISPILFRHGPAPLSEGKTCVRRVLALSELGLS
jgi:hypothetical protein